MIVRLSKPLHDDCPHFKPVDGAYSPYGLLYGFSSNLLEHMALKTLQPDAVTRFSLEDVFTAGEADTDKRAWVSGWRKLPHVEREVAKLYEYPQQFAEDVFARVVQALRRRVADGEANDAAQTGRLVIVPENDRQDSKGPLIPELAVRISDRQNADRGRPQGRGLRRSSSCNSRKEGSSCSVTRLRADGLP